MLHMIPHATIIIAGTTQITSSKQKVMQRSIKLVEIPVTDTVAYTDSFPPCGMPCAFFVFISAQLKIQHASLDIFISSLFYLRYFYPRMNELRDVFGIAGWEGTMEEEDLFYIQQLYFSEHQGIPAIARLISKYPIAPKIVLETLLLAFDTPSLSALESFPYRKCLSLLFSDTECIEALCAARHGLFINLLFRISAEIARAGGTRTLDRLEKLCNLSCAPIILKDKRLWGLERERAGVPDQRDGYFYKIIMSTDIDITAHEDLKMHMMKEVFKQPSGSPGSFIHDISRMALAKHYSDSEYRYPGFLDRLLSVSSPLVQSLASKSSHTTTSVYTLDPANLSMFHDNLSRILAKILRDSLLRDNFMALIKNVCSHERSKLVFDATRNCSDAYAYNLYSLLMIIASGAFRKEYVSKIGANVFPTFAFFYLARLMEISILKAANAVMANRTLSSEIIKRDGRKLRKYLDFVYDVIKGHESVVYAELISAMANETRRTTDSGFYTPESIPNNGGILLLSKRIELVDVSIQERKAESLSDLLHDNAFINTILTIQLFLLPHENDALIDFVSTLFLFPNQHITLAIQILQLSNCKDPVAIKRLIRHYSENRSEDRIMDRMLINKMLLDKDLPADHNTLRTVNTTVSDMEEWLSRALSGILKIKEYKRKGVMLDQLLKEDNPEVELSDEEVTLDPPAERLRIFSEMDDAQIEGYIRRQNPDLDGPEIQNLIASMKGSLLYFKNPRAYKIYCKQIINESRMKQQERILKEELFITENILVTMIHLTNKNRRLFLNKNIFQRLCLIIGKLLCDLLGKDSLSFRIENKEEYRFNPKELLRSLLVVLINLLGGAPVLAQKSRLDPGLLTAGATIAQKKHLLGESNIQVLFGIIDTLQKMKDLPAAGEEARVIPDHFIDPLTFEIMENPVRLLTSKVTIDRSTFNQIMLNDKTDPFSRLPLDETKCVVDEELLKEIREYKRRHS